MGPAGRRRRPLRIGITDYAQEQLGDIVYVHLPDVGEAVEAGAPMGELESTKSVSDLFAPVSGTVAARNEALDAQPGAVQLRPVRRGLDRRDRAERREPQSTACCLPTTTKPR